MNNFSSDFSEEFKERIGVMLGEQKDEDRNVYEINCSEEGKWFLMKEVAGEGCESKAKTIDTSKEKKLIVDKGIRKAKENTPSVLYIGSKEGKGGERIEKFD